MMSEPTSNELPSAVLKTEHRVILRVVDVLERLVIRSQRGDGFEGDTFKQCVEFFRFFADACHHAKEEELLFPALEARGIPRENGPIGCMLEEHTLARGFTKAMGEALDERDRDDAGAEQRFIAAAREYIALLRAHINKEDNVLFNMGDSVLTAEDQSSLCDKFCEVSCRSFGGKKREELERLADEVETRWPN